MAGASALRFGDALYPLRLTLQSIGMTWLVCSALLSSSNELANALLTWGPLRWVGKVSYSLYLWQCLFIEVPSPSFKETAFARLGGFPLNLALMFAAACASYYTVERPFLTLKRRLAR